MEGRQYAPAVAERGRRFAAVASSEALRPCEPLVSGRVRADRNQKAHGTIRAHRTVSS